MAYTAEALTREQVDALPGATVLEFGTNWCPICQDAQPVIAEAFTGRDEIRHVRIEDGKGRKLGRTFGVKLWPTLIVLSDGEEVARVVRPETAHDVQAALAKLPTSS